MTDEPTRKRLESSEQDLMRQKLVAQRQDVVCEYR